MSVWSIIGIVVATWAALLLTIVVVWHQTVQWNKRKGRFKD